MKRWLAVWSLMLAWALVSGASCPVKPPQPPQPACPDSCPEASACTDPAQGCQPIQAPGLVCDCPDGPCCGCYYWPSPSTEWKLATCQSGQTCDGTHHCVSSPAPACPATCPDGQVCLDPIVGCEPTAPPTGCVIPPDEGWTGIAGSPTKAGIVAAAQAAIGARCGQSQHDSLVMLVDRLRAQGECVDQWNDDYIVIRDGPGPKHQQYDVMMGANGCWREPPHFEAVLLPPGVEPPVEPPPPAPSSCSGIPKVSKFRMSPRWDHDSSPVAYNRDGAEDWEGNPAVGYCDSIGDPNLFCEYWDENDPAERQRRERCAMNGLAVWHSDGTVTPVTENPLQLQATCSACTWIEVCAADGVTGCTRSPIVNLVER